jgi:hypothetical protein
MSDFIYNPTILGAIQQGASPADLLTQIRTGAETWAAAGVPQAKINSTLYQRFGVSQSNAPATVSNEAPDPITQLYTLGNQAGQSLTDISKRYSELAGDKPEAEKPKPPTYDFVNQRTGSFMKTDFSRDAKNPYEALLAGYQSSLGKIVLDPGELPSLKLGEGSPWYDHVMSAIGRIAGDIPVLAPTVSAGTALTGNPIVPLMAVEAFRSLYFDALKRGSILNWQDFMDKWHHNDTTGYMKEVGTQFADAAKNALTAGVMGELGTFWSGKAADAAADWLGKPVAQQLTELLGLSAGEAGSTIAAQTILDHHLPSLGEQLSNSLLIGGAHAAGINGAMQEGMFKKYGVVPAQLTKSLKDPARQGVAEQYLDFVSRAQRGVLRYYTHDPVYKSTIEDENSLHDISADVTEAKAKFLQPTIRQAQESQLKDANAQANAALVPLLKQKQNTEANVNLEQKTIDNLTERLKNTSDPVMKSKIENTITSHTVARDKATQSLDDLSQQIYDAQQNIESPLTAPNRENIVSVVIPNSSERLVIPEDPDKRNFIFGTIGKQFAAWRLSKFGKEVDADHLAQKYSDDDYVKAGKQLVLNPTNEFSDFLATPRRMSLITAKRLNGIWDDRPSQVNYLPAKDLNGNATGAYVMAKHNFMIMPDNSILPTKLTKLLAPGKPKNSRKQDIECLAEIERIHDEAIAAGRNIDTVNKEMDSLELVARNLSSTFGMDPKHFLERIKVQPGTKDGDSPDFWQRQLGIQASKNYYTEEVDWDQTKGSNEGSSVWGPGQYFMRSNINNDIRYAYNGEGPQAVVHTSSGQVIPLAPQVFEKALSEDFEGMGDTWNDITTTSYKNEMSLGQFIQKYLSEDWPNISEEAVKTLYTQVTKAVENAKTELLKAYNSAEEEAAGKEYFDQVKNIIKKAIPGRGELKTGNFGLLNFANEELKTAMPFLGKSDIESQHATTLLFKELAKRAETINDWVALSTNGLSAKLDEQVRNLDLSDDFRYIGLVGNDFSYFLPFGIDSTVTITKGQIGVWHLGDSSQYIDLIRPLEEQLSLEAFTEKANNIFHGNKELVDDAIDSFKVLQRDWKVPNQTPTSIFKTDENGLIPDFDVYNQQHLDATKEFAQLSRTNADALYKFFRNVLGTTINYHHMEIEEFRQIRDFMNSIGFNGFFYWGSGDGPCALGLNMSDVSAVQIYRQQEFGSIRFTPERDIISLFQSQRPDTFFHELGHDIFAHLWEAADAGNQRAINQLNHIFNACDLQFGQKLTAEERTKVHEYIGDNFGKFMTTRESRPSDVGMWNRFKNTLMDMYNSIKGSQYGVSKELSDIFDTWAGKASSGEASKAFDETLKSRIAFEKGSRNPGEFTQKTIEGWSDRFAALNKAANKGYFTQSYIEARTAVNSMDRADRFLNHNTYSYDTLQPNGESLQAIMRSVPGQAEDLSALLAAKQMLNMYNSGKSIPNIDVNELQRYIDEKSSNTNLAQAAERAHMYHQRVVNYAFDAGLITPEEFIKWSEDTYTPVEQLQTSIEMSENSRQELGQLLAKNQMSLFWQKLKDYNDAEMKVEDPLVTLVGETYAVMRAASINRTRKAVLQDYGIEQARAGENPDFGSLLGTTNKLRKVTYKEEGKTVSAYVQQDIADAVRNLDEQSLGLLGTIGRGMAKYASLMRLGSTLTPTFTGLNFFKDQLTATLQSRNGYKFGLDFARGLMAVLNDRYGYFPGYEGVYQKWVASGGSQSGMIANDRVFNTNVLKEIYLRNPRNMIRDPQKYWKEILSAMNPFSWGLNVLRSTAEAAENASRLGEFMRAQKAGYNAQESALQSRDVTVDFARAGLQARALNSIIPFLNASIQGNIQVYKLIRNRPGDFFWHTLVGVALPALYLSLAEQDMIVSHPDSQGAQIAKSMPDYERALFHHIYVGDDYSIALRIPYPHGIFAQIGEGIHQMVRGMFESGYTRALPDFANIFWRQLQGFAPNIMPAALTGPLEVATNHSFFTGHKIVSDQYLNVLPFLRYTPNTTEVSKKLSKFFHDIGIGDTMDRWSAPIDIDHLIQATGGGLAINALRALDYYGLTSSEAGERPYSRWTESPIVKAFFFTHPSFSNDAILRFNDAGEEVNQVANSVKMLLRTPNLSSREQGMLLYQQAYIGQVTKIQRSLGKLSKMMNLIANTDQMTGVEKRKQIDNCLNAMSRIASIGLQYIDMMHQRKEMQNAGR